MDLAGGFAFQSNALTFSVGDPLQLNFENSLPNPNQCTIRPENYPALGREALGLVGAVRLVAGLGVEWAGGDQSAPFALVAPLELVVTRFAAQQQP